MHGAPSLRQLLPLAILLLAGVALPPVLPVYYLYIGNLLMMYVILALGLDILLGWSGQFAFAHIAFFGIGIYGTALLKSRLGIPFVLGMPAAATLAALIGFLIALPATRLRTVYLALATFAFAECTQWTLRTWVALTNGPDGLRIKAPDIFGYVIDSDGRAFPVLAILLALVLAGTLCLTRSKLARSFCAIRDSEHVAAASGIDVRRTKVIAFTISAFYAGIAGAAYTLFQSYIHPDGLGVWQLVLVLTMVVVGGSGTLPGVILGVLLLGVLPEALRAAPRSLLVWQEFAYGLILTAAIMFMPRGIWGLMPRRAPRPGIAAAAERRPAARALERQAP
ncbi:MAG: branched-chain amino acid ABC transporter permease [Alphaproteobacteria bacterium]